MKSNLLKIVAACAVLGATIGFANAQNSWYHAVTHRHRTGTSHRTATDYQRDQSYMAGLRRHHEYARLEQFQEREGYDRDDSNKGLHKGWNKGRHNKHHGTGPGHYSG